MKTKRKIWKALTPLLLAVGLIGFAFLRKGGSEVPAYQVEALAKGPIETTVTASGTINPVATVEIGCQVSGRIAKLYADFNTQVKAGQVVAELDQEILRARVETAEASQRSAQASLENARTSLDVAVKKAARNASLFERALISFEEKETSDAALMSAKVALKQAESSAQQSESSLRSSRVDLSHAVITSPIDGTVLERSVNIGQTVAAAMSAPVLFKVASDLTKMQVQCSIDEADIGRVREGQDVRFTVDAVQDRTFSGRVRQVRYSAVTTSNVVTYTTIIDADNAEMLLRPGMTASVTIVTAQAADVLRVANAALRYTPPSASAEEAARSAQMRAAGRGRGALWVLDDLGLPKAVPVRLGLTGSSTTEVGGDGISVGLKVIVGLKTATAAAAAASADMPPPMMFDGGGGPPPPPPGK